jgi:hypothetical protein
MNIIYSEMQLESYFEFIAEQAKKKNEENN